MIYALKQDSEMAHYVEAKVYSVKHFWCGYTEPTEYFVLAKKRPSPSEAVEKLKLDLAPTDWVTVHLLDVVEI